MTDGNYTSLLNNLGKLVKMYDDASADVSAQNLTIAATYDQVATGLAASLEGVVLFAGYANRFQSAVLSGATAIQTVALELAQKYLTTDTVKGYFSTPLTSTTGGTAAQVVVALAAEMTTNSKTMTTGSSTGLIHFLGLIDDETIPASGTPTYADATYCTDTVL